MSITWSRTAADLIKHACSRVQMVGLNQTLPNNLWDSGRDHLNGLLKLLQTQGPNEWRRTNQTVTLVEGQASYTLSPRPDKIRECFYQETADREVIMGRWNYDTYDIMPTKTQKGRPNVYTVDRQRSDTNLLIWPTPDTAAATRTIRVSFDRVLEDIVNVDDIVDVPQEWLDVVMDVVGYRVATSFNVHNQTTEKVGARADVGLQDVLGHDSEESITFVLGGM